MMLMRGGSGFADGGEPLRLGGALSSGVPKFIGVADA
jgi:hypothetical protein